MSTIDAQNEFDRNAARVEAESRNQLGTVTIPRAQHEALMAAAKALTPFQSGDWGKETAWIVEGAEVCATREEGIQAATRFSRLRAEADEVLAALRAAGIPVIRAALEAALSGKEEK